MEQPIRCPVYYYNGIKVIYDLTYHGLEFLPGRINQGGAI